VALALMEYPPERRGVAMGWLGVMGSLASLSGPVLAGNIIDLGGSWRWVFLVSLPVAVLVLATGRRYLQEAKDESAANEPLDFLGVLLGVAASGLLTFGVIKSGEWGLLDPRTLGVVAIALAFGGLFVWRCSASPAPLLRLGIFHHHRFLVATVSQLGSQFAIFAFFFWTPLFLVNVWGWSVSGVGWAVAVPLVVSFNSVPIGRFADRHGYRGVLVVGGLFGSASLLWCVLFVGDQPRFYSQLLPALLLFGWGIGMVGITSAAAALSGLMSEELAMANSVFQTTRRVVQTLGIATVVAILGDRSADSLSLFRWVWIVTGAAFLLSVVAALWYPVTRLRAAPAAREPIGRTLGSEPARPSPN
jgi:MFS family permease